MEKFVCAFRGRRDSYQAPLALSEAGLLDQFITDAYATKLVRAVARLAPPAARAKVSFRSEPDIPVERVRCLWGTTALEHIRHRCGYDPTATFSKLDRVFSLTAAHRAAQKRANLFLYSSYAWEAFTAHYAHTPVKVLFQYHPHPDLEKRILAEDDAQHSVAGELFSTRKPRIFPNELVRRERDCWKHADLIFCASTFTKWSLIQAGADEAKCNVVPYGIETPAIINKEQLSDAFHALFIGSGCQRKGLHHLLLAWRAASLPTSSKLTLICRVIDPEIRRLAAATPRVELCLGVGAAEVTWLYTRNSLFVMPSLVEGFGQVYLEALAQGCPVLGTANTCLPDIGGEMEGIFLVSPGNVCELTAALERLADFLPRNQKLRTAARRCAAKFTWPHFRGKIKIMLKSSLL